MMKTWIQYRPLVIFFLLCAYLGILYGCDKYSRYRVLSFLFDGVPHPEAPQKKDQSASLKTAKAGQPKREPPSSQPIRYSHPPAAGKEDDCSYCHGAVKRVALPPKDMCINCHGHLKDSRPFIHGPAAVDCVVCHDVHGSQAKALVKKIGNPLCFECHDKEKVKEAEIHKGMKEEELVCLNCHDPHGGKDKFFLK